MSSRSTLHRHTRGNRINSSGTIAMVSCKYCAKHGKECRLSSLSKKCGNCEFSGIAKCEPVDLPVPDFSRIDSELARLEALEEEADEAEEAALLALQAARSKRSRIAKQKKLLKRREQRWFDASAQYVADLDFLENQERVLDDVTLLENGMMPGSFALEWAVYPPPEDPNTVVDEGVGTSATSVGSS
jgi:hypothetical protein